MSRFAKVLFSFMTCAMMTLTAICAEDGINANEKIVLKSLNKEIHVNGKTIELNSKFISGIKSYFMKKGVDLTDEQRVVLITQIKAAKKVIVSNNITNLDSISKRYQKQILDIAQVAAKTLGFTISINYSTKSVTVKDYSDNIVFFAKNAFKNIDNDYTSILAISGLVAIGLALLIIIIVKKKHSV